MVFKSKISEGVVPSFLVENGEIPTYWRLEGSLPPDISAYLFSALCFTDA